MPVIGFAFRSINASVEEKNVAGNIDVNSTPSIENIKKKELTMPEFKDVLSVEFKFVTKYKPEIGSIEITGEVLYQTNDAKRMASMWKDGKKIDGKAAADILNTIFKKCLTKAVSIADELRLPPPLNFPNVAPAPPRKTSAE